MPRKRLIDSRQMKGPMDRALNKVEGLSGESCIIFSTLQDDRRRGLKHHESEQS